MNARSRGRAPLPNLELIRLELLILDSEAFKAGVRKLVERLSGSEGGLAPAHGLRD